MTTYGPQHPGPRPVGASLDRVVAALGAPPAPVLEAVFGCWADLVGPAVAAHARPASLAGGVLVVNVDEPAWGSELRYLAPQLLSRIAAALGTGTVTRMEVRVRPRPTRGEGSPVVE